MSARTGFAALLAPALVAGSLQGPVKIVDKDGKTRDSLRDCIAILEPLGPKPALDKHPLRIRTVGKRFAPRVAWTTPGSPIAFPNQDHILHNVFSVTPGSAFDTGHYEPGESPKWTAKGPGLVKLYCNVHHKMNAFLWVVETPWAEVLDGQSGLAFRDLPSGRYLLRLWHPETGEKSFEVKVGDGATVGDWTLSASLPAFEPHKNKFGKDYPPTKDEGSY
jgi:plastocyanin